MGEEWEMELPSTQELIPLTKSLITPQLAYAFGITMDNLMTFGDVYGPMSPKEDHLVMGSESPKRSRSSIVPNEVKSSGRDVNGSGRAVKKPRLVWTPQLHKRFVDVIEHLGMNKAVPKTIMEMMNVEGLTRENVASHLQKYRLYLRRVEGLANEANSNTRRETTSTLFHSDGFGSVSNPMPSFPMVGPPTGNFGAGFGQRGLNGFNCGIESGGFGLFWNRQRSL